MRLTDQLNEWRKPEYWDDGTDITDEKVLQQFLFSAISDFIEAKWGPLGLKPEPAGDEGNLISAFVDEYSAP